MITVELSSLARASLAATSDASTASARTEAGGGGEYFTFPSTTKITPSTTIRKEQNVCLHIGSASSPAVDDATCGNEPVGQ